MGWNHQLAKRLDFGILFIFVLERLFGVSCGVQLHLFFFQKCIALVMVTLLHEEQICHYEILVLMMPRYEYLIILFSPASTGWKWKMKWFSRWWFPLQEDQFGWLPWIFYGGRATHFEACLCCQLLCLLFIFELVLLMPTVPSCHQLRLIVYPSLSYYIRGFASQMVRDFRIFFANLP